MAYYAKRPADVIACTPQLEDRTLDPMPNTTLRIMETPSEGYLLISYKTQLLQQICFRTSTAIEYLGEEAAISLQARHSDIQAASNVFELPVGQVSVDGNLCTLTVPDVLSIVMAPNYAAAVDGSSYDWSTVERVKLMGINDVR